MENEFYSFRTWVGRHGSEPFPTFEDADASARRTHKHIGCRVSIIGLSVEGPKRIKVYGA